LHHKHKSYAFSWKHKEEHQLIMERNLKMKTKMKEIRSYFHFKRTNPDKGESSHMNEDGGNEPGAQ
jgi:uncharacterized protein YjcR